MTPNPFAAIADLYDAPVRALRLAHLVCAAPTYHRLFLAAKAIGGGYEEMVDELCVSLRDHTGEISISYSALAQLALEHVVMCAMAPKPCNNAGFFGGKLSK